MVPEHQLLGVRLEIDLAGQVLHVETLHVVADQGHRHDERHEPRAVVLDDGEQLRARLRVEDALVRSVNTATVRLQEEVGRAEVFDLARRLGVAFPLPDSPGFAMGLSESAPVEVARLYATFANGGRPIEPYLLQGIRTKRGEILFWAAPEPGAPAVSETALAALRRGLEAVVTRGTGRAAAIDEFNYRLAGKTGTTQHYRDAWFAGFCRDLTAVVWVGNDDNSPMSRVTGGSIPARIFRDFAGFAASRQDFREAVRIEESTETLDLEAIEPEPLDVPAIEGEEPAEAEPLDLPPDAPPPPDVAPEDLVVPPPDAPAEPATP